MGKREKRPSWFKMFRHQKALIDSVSDAEVGRAMKAVFQYFENGETPDMTPIEFAVFSSMKPYVDESFSDFARNSKKNAENINKRWEKQRDTSGTSGIQSLPLIPHDTTDTEAEAEEKPLRVFPRLSRNLLTNARHCEEAGGRCGNLLQFREKRHLFTMKYLKIRGIATPVCGLVRNDSVFNPFSTD